MAQRGQHGPCSRRGRPACRVTALGAVLALSLHFVAVGSAKADDLPAQLLAASRLIPVDRDGRQVCIGITGLANQLRMPIAFGDNWTRVAASNDYSAITRGAYLGNGPLGAPAPPFAQALLDAGAAKRVTLTWIQHTRVPGLAVPRLTDLGSSRPTSGQASPPPFHDQEVSVQGDAYLVTGPDSELFARDETGRLGPVAPSLESPGAIGPAAGSPDPGSPPPDVWSASRVCYTLVPDRVLEYGAVEDHGNNVSEISAAVLFHPDRLPGWISDPRVIETLRPSMLPKAVRVLTFRNDGDGWRPGKYALWSFVRGRTHIVGLE